MGKKLAKLDLKPNQLIVLAVSLGCFGFGLGAAIVYLAIRTSGQQLVLTQGSFGSDSHQPVSGGFASPSYRLVDPSFEIGGSDGKAARPVASQTPLKKKTKGKNKGDS